MAPRHRCDESAQKMFMAEKLPSVAQKFRQGRTSGSRNERWLRRAAKLNPILSHYNYITKINLNQVPLQHFNAQKKAGISPTQFWKGRNHMSKLHFHLKGDEWRGRESNPINIRPRLAGAPTRLSYKSLGAGGDQTARRLMVCMSPTSRERSTSLVSSNFTLSL